MATDITIDPLQRAPVAPPAPARPAASVGEWVRRNLFPDWRQGLLTVVVLWLLVPSIPPLVQWLLIDATWTGTRDDCVAAGGACWAFVHARWGQFLYGFYPVGERWRVDLAMAGLVAALVPLFLPRLPHKGWIVLGSVLAYPVVGYFLLYGGVFGLPVVQTSRWGGFMLTLVVAVTGMVGSLPAGVLLALGRRSTMPAIRIFCIAFIELFRAVPLITVLFMASVMLPLFLPSGFALDKLLRALIGVALFNGALMAEVIRGGLQAIPKGEYEAATAAGMGYWRMTLLIVLPPRRCGWSSRDSSIPTWRSSRTSRWCSSSGCSICSASSRRRRRTRSSRRRDRSGHGSSCPRCSRIERERRARSTMPSLMQAPKPRTTAEFEARLLAERHRLTRRMLEAGGYVIENPHEVALNSVAVLARKSGLPATSFVGLAQAMGFAGFGEMQKLFLAPLRAAYPPSLQERIRHASGEQVMADPDDVVALGRSFVAANVASLGHLAERLATLPLDRAIDLILGARVVYVLGIDRSHATATYLAYALNRAGVQAVPMVGLGHFLREHATNMHADDVLVAISFPPYAEERVAVVATWRQRGNAVLAVTNSTVSPIADGARAVLAVEDAELHGFRSLSALICLVQTRVMGLAYRKRRVEGGIDIDA